MNKTRSVIFGLALHCLFSGGAAAASVCDSVGDDDDNQLITDAQSEECTVSPQLGIFIVNKEGSVDVTPQGPGSTAVYIPDNNLELFENAGTIVSTSIGVRVTSKNIVQENETHN